MPERDTHVAVEMAAFVSDLTYSDLPADLVDAAVNSIVDTAGVAVAGSTARPGEVVRETVATESGGDRAVSLLGTDERAPPPEAALVNATAAHALDYDDSSLYVHAHPSATTAPTVLGLAARDGRSGAAVVTAYLAGVEVQYYLAAVMDVGAHVDRGWHATATLGTFGATAAAAWLRGLDEEEVTNAFTVAASKPAGLKVNFGTMTKPLHAGHAARSGEAAAALAANGFTASADAVDGEGGFVDVYSGSPPADVDSVSIGDPWLFLEDDTYHRKEYPCCACSHPTIAAVEGLLAERAVDPGDVQRVEVTAPAYTAEELRHSDPSTALEGKFSMEHAVAWALLEADVGLDAFTESAVGDDAVAAMRERVEFEVDPDNSFGSYDTTVRIETADGTFERRESEPPGTHADPLCGDALREKFLECTTRAVPEADALAAYRQLTSLPDLEDVGSVVDLLTR